jgi:hypothetical protein
MSSGLSRLPPVPVNQSRGELDALRQRQPAQRVGRVVGRSDAQGGVPADNPVHVSDFVATMYHALGYGPETSVTDPTGRPHLVVEGKLVLELF